MTEPRSEVGLVRYYCTAGNGMEPFLMDEVKRKLAAEDVCQLPGKVLFSSSARVHRVAELKAAERLFLLLKHDSPVRLPASTCPAKAASVLQSRLLGDRSQWTGAVLTWSRLQGELADRRTTVNTSSAAPGAMRMRQGGRGSEEQGEEEEEEEEECSVETGKSTREQGELESGTRRPKGGGEENGAQTMEKKRKREAAQRGESCEAGAQLLEKKIRRDNEEASGCDKNVDKQRTSERERKREDKVGCEEESRVAPGIDNDMENSSRIIDDTAEHCTVEHVKTAAGEDNAPLPPSRIKPEITSSGPVSFRISCKCTGSLSRCFSSQEVSRVIGVGLGRQLGWKADLKNPQLEVNVHLSDDHCLLGLPLTRLPLANRSYIKTTGLRSTIAWAMASLAQIEPGFCVLDPMCGVGTILIEAAQEHQAAWFLGMDIDDRQLQKANENVEFAHMRNRIHLLKASSIALPLPSASVDAVVCDLPFGRKFGTKANMAANLPVIVAEMERVLCVGGTLVLLLSPQLSCLLKKHLAQKDTGPMSNPETKPQTGIQDCPPPPLTSRKQQTFQTDPQQHSPPPPLSSLKHQATLRVSLGTIDGLIHKYVKTDV